MNKLFLRLLTLAALLVPSLAFAQTPGTFQFIDQQPTGAAVATTDIYPCAQQLTANKPLLQCTIAQLTTYISSYPTTLTNKTISGAANTLTNLPAGQLTNFGAEFTITGSTFHLATTGITAGSYTCPTVTWNAFGQATTAANGSCSGGGGGGTVSNSGTLTTNALIIGGGTTVVSALASLGTTTTLLHGNASGPPTFGAANFATDMTGNILLANMNSGTSASATTVFTGSGTTGAWAQITPTMFATASAMTFLGGPTSGSAATPTFRSLAITDLPPIPDQTQTGSTSYTFLSTDMGGQVNLSGTGNTLNTGSVSATLWAPGMQGCYSNIGTSTWTLAGLTVNGLRNSSLKPGAWGCMIANISGTLDWIGMQPPTTTVLGGVLAFDCTTISSNSVLQKINTDGTISCAAPSGTGTVTVSGGGNLTAHGVAIGEGTQVIASTATGTTGIPLIGQGGSADPIFGTAVVAGGGTGAVTFTAHGMLIGEGTGPIVAAAAMTNGQMMLGATGADPAPQTMSQDCTLTTAGVITCLKTNNVAFTTAATTSIGQSGATIPLLNAINTWSAAQTFSTIQGYIANLGGQTGTSCTLSGTSGAGCGGNTSTGDCGTYIVFTAASAVTVTIPQTLPIGCQIALEQKGAGKVSLTTSGSATLHSAHSFTGTSAQYAVIGITIDANSGGTAADAILTGDGA